jgi:manganese efflux pump family protein
MSLQSTEKRRNVSRKGAETQREKVSGCRGDSCYDVIAIELRLFERCAVHTLPCSYFVIEFVMSILTILALALGLALDAFSVAIAVGIRLPKLSFRPIFRLSWHFGLFQFLMPIIGWLTGVTIQQWVSAFDHWIAFGLLAFIGGKMIYESFQTDTEKKAGDPTRGWSLVILSIATSIDALAVGLSLAVVGVAVWFPSVIIGIVAGLMTILGMHLGRKLGVKFGHRMEFVGGVILITIGIKILCEHLFS